MSAFRYVVEILDLLDNPSVSGEEVRKFFTGKGYDKLPIYVETLKGVKGVTDFVSILVSGVNGKSVNGTSPTLGVIGRLGGIGARPIEVGIVSDADGAVVALATVYMLAEMKRRGDVLPGDVKITTHICPNAPTRPHKPAAMMESPVDIFTLLKKEVSPEMDAVLSIDATKANYVVKHNGFAITPTVKQGWILKVSQDLMNIYMCVAGHMPVIVPITMQDIIPFSTPAYHLNSMMQPWLFTDAPVVGVAITSEMIVPGSATGANNILALEQATRFVVEVAKGFGKGDVKFYDEDEFQTIVKTHGHVRDILAKTIEPRECGK
ncbi:MAG: DUF1177 domain-containing protein [Candidatus Caldarchaeum sp.]|uniref:DUF1177 domain-containing protein n=1 Tax=Caldiarchaeum subterraneum TaxID=311458 RepID=A0A7C5Y5N3_CALS0